MGMDRTCYLNYNRSSYKAKIKITKNGKYLITVIFCHSPVVSCNEGRVDGEFNFIFGHIFTKFTEKLELVIISPSVL